jgi:hypothetical protein
MIIFIFKDKSELPKNDLTILFDKKKHLLKKDCDFCSSTNKSFVKKKTFRQKKVLTKQTEEGSPTVLFWHKIRPGADAIKKFTPNWGIP